MRRRLTLLLLCLLAACPFARAQFGTLTAPSSGNTGNLFTNPALTPEKSFLLDLDRKFSTATAEGGGAAFASWFAPNAVLIPEGKPPVLGQAAIATHSNWTTTAYHLTWTPEGARMNPDGTTGFTWGHYEGRAKNPGGAPIVVTGRYTTIWEKQPDGKWKVALETTNKEPPPTQDCTCKLP